VVWLFERGAEELEIETHYHAESGEYLLTVKRPDGTHQTERFHHVATFRERLERLEAVLNADRWKPNGSPTALHDAWQI
jgi:hypothetical protein